LTNDPDGHNIVCMTHQNPLQIILARWPSRQALADDAGVDLFAVHRWFQRGSVNGRHDMSLLSGAQRRGINLTAFELMEARAALHDRSGHALAIVQGAGQDQAPLAQGSAE
jgi:hypothetical protein